MLAALIANLQNVVQPEKLPTVHVDRGGGGQSWPQYDIIDIMAATHLFPEIAGEDSVARAVRRQKWIGDALPHVKEARERRDAGVFLTGAQLGYAAGYEAGASARADVTADLPDVVVTEAAAAWARDAAMPRAEQSRGTDGGGAGVGLLVAAIAIGGVALLSRSSRSRRRRY